jgi:hypothetical protein
LYSRILIYNFWTKCFSHILSSFFSLVPGKTAYK